MSILHCIAEYDKAASGLLGHGVNLTPLSELSLAETL